MTDDDGNYETKNQTFFGGRREKTLFGILGVFLCIFVLDF